METEEGRDEISTYKMREFVAFSVAVDVRV